MTGVPDPTIYINYYYYYLEFYVLKVESIMYDFILFHIFTYQAGIDRIR